jgi:hypothetical protein
MQLLKSAMVGMRGVIDMLAGDGVTNVSVPAVAVVNTDAMDGVTDNLTQTGSVTSAAVVLLLNTTGYAAGSFQITSIGAGNTVTFEDSNDGVNWTPMSCNPAAVYASYSTTAAALGKYIFGITAAYIRARVSTYSSGTVTITSCLKRSKGDSESAFITVLSTSSSTIGMIAGYAGYAEYSTALAASAAMPIQTTRYVSANPTASYFNARAYSDVAGTMTIEHTANSGTTWVVVGSAAVPAATATVLRVPVTGVANSASGYRVRYTNGATAQTLFSLTSSFTIS